MKFISPKIRIALLIATAAVTAVLSQSDLFAQDKKPTALTVVWSSDDPYVAHRVCLMYTHAAKSAKWFDEVELIVWGPSAKLLAEDEKVQEKVQQMQKSGVIVRACIVCANAYGVTEKLRALGLEVKGMGKPLSDRLQSGRSVLTF